MLASGEFSLPKLKPPARLHVVLAPHIAGERLLSYENALALQATVLMRTDNAGEYVLEIHEHKRLTQLQSSLPHWERSGACTAWWVEKE